MAMTDDSGVGLVKMMVSDVGASSMPIPLSPQLSNLCLPLAP